MDSVEIKLHGSDVIEFEITPYIIPPPIPLWKLALVSLSIIGSGAAGFVVIKGRRKKAG